MHMLEAQKEKTEIPQTLPTTGLYNTYISERQCGALCDPPHFLAHIPEALGPILLRRKQHFLQVDSQPQSSR